MPTHHCADVQFNWRRSAAALRPANMHAVLVCVRCKGGPLSPQPSVRLTLVFVAKESLRTTSDGMPRRDVIVEGSIRLADGDAGC